MFFTDTIIINIHSLLPDILDKVEANLDSDIPLETVAIFYPENLYLKRY